MTNRLTLSVIARKLKIYEFIKHLEHLEHLDLLGTFEEINGRFKPNLVSLWIIYQKTFQNRLCKKCGMVTSLKLPLYCIQTVCIYYSSCISFANKIC